jgi:hypothetical protein
LGAIDTPLLAKREATEGHHAAEQKQQRGMVTAERSHW